mmetsp:Transcript_5986/g.19448  ORF Transcript_5986/g.19448 Transcript_5986/m.19448 type:complete len:229 (+) Transcript_5986:1767-2453(+)
MPMPFHSTRTKYRHDAMRITKLAFWANMLSSRSMQPSGKSVRKQNTYPKLSRSLDDDESSKGDALNERTALLSAFSALGFSAAAALQLRKRPRSKSQARDDPKSVALRASVAWAVDTMAATFCEKRLRRYNACVAAKALGPKILPKMDENSSRSPPPSIAFIASTSVVATNADNEAITRIATLAGSQPDCWKAAGKSKSPGPEMLFTTRANDPNHPILDGSGPRLSYR